MSRIRIRSLSALLLAGGAAILPQAGAFAQQAEGADEGGGQSAGDRRDTVIVITAERRETNLQDTPLSVVAVNQETVMARGIEDLQDLGNFTPNLNITGGRGSGNQNPAFSIRGVGGGGGATGERGVGLYIDGIFVPRTNGTVLRVLDIERIEVLRGPQGTLFGRNSTGGAIRYFTRRPTLGEFEGYIRTTAANLERSEVVGAVNVPIGDDAALRFQGAYFNQGGWVERGGQNLGEQQDYLGRVDLRVAATDRLTIDAGLLYSRSTNNGSPNVFEEFDMRPGIGEGFWEGNYADWLGDSLIAAGGERIAAFNDPRIVIDDFTAPGFCLIDEWHPAWNEACAQFERSEFIQGSLVLGYELSPNVSITSTSGVSNLANKSNVDWQYLGMEERLNDLESTTFYQELQLNAALFENTVDLVVGANYFHETASNALFVQNRRGTSDTPRGGPFANTLRPNDNLDAGLFVREDNVTSQRAESFGLFASATWALTDRLNLTGGLRYAYDYKDYERVEFPADAFSPVPGTDRTIVTSDADWHEIDWRATVDYRLADDWMWYATVSKAYKAGSYGGLAVISNVRGEDQSGEFLRPVDPERVINYETGMRIEAFDRRVRFNPTVFYMQWSNRQAARQANCAGQAGCPEPPGFNIEIVNSGDVDIYGVELDGQVFLTDFLWLDGSFGYLGYDLKDPVANMGPNLFPGTPEINFNIGANYEQQVGPGALTMNLNWVYTGDQPTHPSAEGDSAYQLPAFSLVNARVRYQPDSVPVSISLFANNLLNNTYATFATRFGGGFWDRGGPLSAQIPLSAPERSALFVIRGMPRQFGVMLQYDF